MFDSSPAFYGLQVPQIFLLLNQKGDPACVFEKKEQWYQYNINRDDSITLAENIWADPDEDFGIMHNNAIILDCVDNWKTRYDEITSDDAFWVDFFG